MRRCHGTNMRRCLGTRSVTVTKGGHPRGGGLYETSETMGRGVAELRGQFSM